MVGNGSGVGRVEGDFISGFGRVFVDTAGGKCERSL